MKYGKYLLFLVLLLPAFVMRDHTPDNELRYLSIADEALRDHSFFAFHNHGLAYADKPPLYLWLVMLGKALFGVHSMLYLSLLSLIPAMVILITMDKWLENSTDKKNRATLQLMLLSTGYFIGSAVVLRMDIMMTMFIVLAMRTFYKMYTGEGGKYDSVLFPVYVFMALFTKGPVGILLPLLSVLVFLLIQRKIKTFGKYWGWKTWGILLLGCAAWFSAVYWEGGKEYLNNLLFNQTVNRAIDAFHHKRPFYYYFVSIWYILAPWSLFYIGLTIAAVRRKAISTDLERLLLTVAVVTLLMLSSFSSKVDVYMLPSIPFFSALAILLFQKRDNTKLSQWLLAIPVGVVTLAAPVAVVLSFTPKMQMLQNVFIYIALAILFSSGVMSLLHLLRHRNTNRAINSFSFGLLLTVFVGSFALPLLNNRIGYGEMCKTGLEMAREAKVNEFYLYNIRRGENVDVYLQKEAHILEDKDIQNGINGKGVLFFRQRDVEKNEQLRQITAGKTVRNTGEYSVVVL